MRTRRWLTRSLWLLVVFSLGVSFVGRALAMRAGVSAAMVQAAQTASGGAHRMPMGAGATHDPMPCPQHDGQCCAPCLACCAACASLPVAVAARATSATAPSTRVVDAAARSTEAPRSADRHLRPPQIGPPSPLVS